MKTITVNYNLQQITQRPEAHLSDLFILLYTIFLIKKNGGTPTRYVLNKLFPYIFDKLESKGELSKLMIFNLPFYKMKGGHYNKSLSQKYLKTLADSNLVIAEQGAAYELTSRAKAIIKEYLEDKGIPAESNEFENLVEEFVKKFLKDSDYWKIYKDLGSMSHTMLVEDSGSKKRVDDLEIDDFKAISYNSANFKKGEPSDLVPEPYLTLLAHELQENQEVTKEDLEQVDALLSRYA